MDCVCVEYVYCSQKTVVTYNLCSNDAQNRGAKIHCANHIQYKVAKVIISLHCSLVQNKSDTIDTQISTSFNQCCIKISISSLWKYFDIITVLGNIGLLLLLMFVYS